MAKSYNGLDRTEAFFAHYGRKGMKRGMNIYNPDYKPIGEKAQAKEAKPPKAPGVTFTENVITENIITEKANRKPPSKKTSNVGSLSSTDPRYTVKKGSLADTDPRFKKQTETSAKDREREAMETASKAGSAATAKRKAEERREKLLEGERRRQTAKYEKAQSERESDAMADAAKKATMLGYKAKAKDDAYKEAVQSMYMEDLRGLKAIGGLIINSDPDATHTNQYLNSLLQDAQKALEAVKDAKLSGDRGVIEDAEYNYRIELASFMKAYMKAMSDRVAGK